ncbi:hypothetical protein CerSpe_047970 [Prunus speciosa]
MAELDQTQPKWERKTSGEIKGQTAEQVWPLLADFCNLQQWRSAGATRRSDLRSSYCTDPADREATHDRSDQAPFELQDGDNNLGFKSYIGWCKIEWSFVSDPD